MEQSHLSVRRTLAKIGIPPTTFYRWYDRFVEHGPEGLEDRPSSPSRVWNRIPDAVRDRILALAFEEPELSPRELAVRFTDTEKYFVSEASVYRLLKSHDLITSPAYIVIRAADEFKDKTTAPNQMWQMSAISTLGTVWRDCLAEGLRLIFIPVGVEDDEEPKDRASETRDDQGPCRASREGHPACDAQVAFF